MAAILCAFCKRSKTACQPDPPTLLYTLRTKATVVLVEVRNLPEKSSLGVQSWQTV
ncbi:hypothetical protein JOE21_000126 [Desmospora profundinema]|uniref:Uncharacterized protein n=1 Tax=Desmospora profundinema TaxID=1571184 RepID=A0ABU1IH86_9BACL|nr:hypothetical protein [Desmospora profundinema]